MDDTHFRRLLESVEQMIAMERGELPPLREEAFDVDEPAGEDS